MKIYTNDVIIKNMLPDLFPGCEINNSINYDLAIINLDVGKQLVSATYVYTIAIETMKNEELFRSFIKKLILVAEEYKQEYVCSIFDEIVNMD